MLPNALRWLFVDRATGRIVVAQWPNLTLWIVVAAWAADRVLRPSDGAAFWLHVVRDVALVVWAGDEIVRGVNPWRRLLGAGVLAGLALSRFA